MAEEQCLLMQSVLLYSRGLYRSTDASTCEGIMVEFRNRGNEREAIISFK